LDSEFIKLSKTLLLELTEEELEVLQKRAKKEETTSRNILRRALREYMKAEIPEGLFSDRTQGNKRSKDDRLTVINP
jgi:hypothetical protein